MRRIKKLSILIGKVHIVVCFIRHPIAVVGEDFFTSIAFGIFEMMALIFTTASWWDAVRNVHVVALIEDF